MHNINTYTYLFLFFLTVSDKSTKHPWIRVLYNTLGQSERREWVSVSVSECEWVDECVYVSVHARRNVSRHSSW